MHTALSKQFLGPFARQWHPPWTPWCCSEKAAWSCLQLPLIPHCRASSDLESWAKKSVADFPVDKSSWFCCFQCKSLPFPGSLLNSVASEFLSVCSSPFFPRICRLRASGIWEKANFKNKQASTLQFLHLIIPLPLVEYLCPATITVSKHYCY